MYLKILSACAPTLWMDSATLSQTGDDAFCASASKKLGKIFSTHTQIDALLDREEFI